MISAIYFNGRDGTAHKVQLGVQEHAIHLLGQGIDLLFPRGLVTFNEPFDHAPDLLELGNGAQCEVHDEHDKTELRDLFGYQPSLVVRWQSMWQAALAATAIMVGLLLCAYLWGIPKLAASLADRIPSSVETKIGAEMLPVLDKSLFNESRLSDIRMQQARDIFDSIKPAHSRLPMTLIFRASAQLGANAIALPGGRIVVTDKLIIDITAKSGDLTGAEADQLAGVLAHEIGHIEQRHTLKALLSNSAVAAISASLFGDFSVAVATVPTILVGSEYSRAMESEADSYAIQLLRQHGISPACLADVFELLRKNSEKSGAKKMPRWMRVASDFSASHPSDAQRIERFRKAAAESAGMTDKIPDQR